MHIVRGYEPVSKLDTNIMTSRRMMASLNFSESEIDKVETGLKARRQLLKSIRSEFHPLNSLLNRLRRKGEPKPLSCDICRKSVFWILKRFAPDEYHGDWSVMQFTPEESDESQVTQLTPEGYDGSRVYTVIPPGVVIDYNGGKVYVLCGLCQFRLGLEATESGLLIHGIKDGYGYVDLDRIENLIGESKRGFAPLTITSPSP